MNDFKRLYPFIRPYRAGLVLSLLLFSLVGYFQSTITTLSLPLFDNILMAEKSAAPAETPKEGLVQKYVSFILSFMPGSLITKLCLALFILDRFQGNLRLLLQLLHEPDRSERCHGPAEPAFLPCSRPIDEFFFCEFNRASHVENERRRRADSGSGVRCSGRTVS